MFRSRSSRSVSQAQFEASQGAAGSVSPSEREELARLRRENKVLKQERDVLKKRWPSSQRRTAKVQLYRCGERRLAGADDVSDVVGFGEWILRVPRVHAALPAKGVHVSRKRVIRLMQRVGLRGRTPRAFTRTTESVDGTAAAENLLNRDFTATAPEPAFKCRVPGVRGPSSQAPKSQPPSSPTGGDGVTSIHSRLTNPPAAGTVPSARSETMMHLLFLGAFAFAQDAAPVTAPPPTAAPAAPAPVTAPPPTAAPAAPAPIFTPTFHLRVDSAGFTPEAAATVTNVFRDEWARGTRGERPLACPLEGCGERERPWIWLTVAKVGEGAAVVAYRYSDGDGPAAIGDAVETLDELPHLIQSIAVRMLPKERPIAVAMDDAPVVAAASPAPDAVVVVAAPPDEGIDRDLRFHPQSQRDNLPGMRIGVGLPFMDVMVPVVTVAYAHRLTDKSGFSEWDATFGLPSDLNFRASLVEVSTSIGRAFSIHAEGGDIYFGGGIGLGVLVHEYPQVAGVFYGEAGWLNGHPGEQRWFLQARSRALVSTDGEPIPELTAEAGIGF